MHDKNKDTAISSKQHHDGKIVPPLIRTNSHNNHTHTDTHRFPYYYGDDDCFVDCECVYIVEAAEKSLFGSHFWLFLLGIFFFRR